MALGFPILSTGCRSGAEEPVPRARGVLRQARVRSCEDDGSVTQRLPIEPDRGPPYTNARLGEAVDLPEFLVPRAARVPWIRTSREESSRRSTWTATASRSRAPGRSRYTISTVMPAWRLQHGREPTWIRTSRSARCRASSRDILTRFPAAQRSRTSLIHSRSRAYIVGRALKARLVSSAPPPGLAGADRRPDPLSPRTRPPWPLPSARTLT